ncbi:MAG: hypothetical protein QOG49_690 [Frankiaceae bacterium]|nr:hypothetical protein [Frankiaceae bacterium]
MLARVAASSLLSPGARFANVKRSRAAPPRRVWRSQAQARRRSLLVRLGGGGSLAILLVAAGWYLRSRPPTPGTVRVYDAATGRKLWSRETDGGFVVVLAVTPGAALVADADDCIHGGPGTVEILTPHRTTFVASTSGCAVYRFVPAYGVDVRRTPASPGRLVVTIPSQLGRGTASLPCPCPESTPAPNGTWGTPVNRGAYARVQLGEFVIGSD